MNQYSGLRPGNLVSYSGRLGTKTYAQIKEIRQVEENRSMIWFSPRFEWDKEFVGYSDEIRPIYLTPYHLSNLQFTFNPDTRYYTVKGITISSFCLDPQ